MFAGFTAVFNYLKDVKHNLNNCTLISDRGYISADYQLDLFTYSKINLPVPLRKNQHHYMSFSKVKGKIRKRIETNFSQLYGQFLWATNHAKSFLGLARRLLSKITAFTIIQYLNLLVFKKPINNIKSNLSPNSHSLRCSFNMPALQLVAVFVLNV